MLLHFVSISFFLSPIEYIESIHRKVWKPSKLFKFNEVFELSKMYKEKIDIFSAFLYYSYILLIIVSILSHIERMTQSYRK